MHRNNKGFTLVELMVVIGIIGLLAGVVGLAVTGAFAGAKAKLDAQELQKFRQDLNLAIEDGNQNRVVLLIGEQESFAKLVGMLAQKSILSYDVVKRLAGATGTKAKEEEYKNGTADTTENILFTGPKDAKVLSRLVKSGKREPDGILFCYNQNLFNRYPNDGFVFVACGETDGKIVKFEQLDLEWKEEGKKKPKLPDPKGSADFYGKYPFEHVAKE